jgi:hypothetical protein
LSDSFDGNDPQARIDISTGDLPSLSRINVLADLNFTTSSSCTDEGRAIMQLVYDIVPGANNAVEQLHDLYTIQRLAERGYNTLAIVIKWPHGKIISVVDPFKPIIVSKACVDN